MKLYVAHQLKYRQRIKKMLEFINNFLPTLNFHNPFYSEYRKEIHMMDKGLQTRFDFTKEESIKIRNIDIENIKKSDGILAILLDLEVLGSYMEIFFCAYILHKPVYLITCNEHIFNHLWIKSLSDRRFKNIDDFIIFMKKELGVKNETSSN